MDAPQYLSTSWLLPLALLMLLLLSLCLKQERPTEMMALVLATLPMFSNLSSMEAAFSLLRSPSPLSSRSTATKLAPRTAALSVGSTERALSDVTSTTGTEENIISVFVVVVSQPTSNLCYVCNVLKSRKV